MLYSGSSSDGRTLLARAVALEGSGLRFGFRVYSLAAGLCLMVQEPSHRSPLVCVGRWARNRCREPKWTAKFHLWRLCQAPDGHHSRHSWIEEKKRTPSPKSEVPAVMHTPAGRSTGRNQAAARKYVTGAILVKSSSQLEYYNQKEILAQHNPGRETLGWNNFGDIPHQWPLEFVHFWGPATVSLNPKP